MNREQIISKGKEVVRVETEAVQNLIDGIDENFAKTVEHIFNSNGRVVFTCIQQMLCMVILAWFAMMIQ
ncbi:MAG: arabinose-5-phosphate [Ignavibacteria bacterium]|nr:MAG: arabinose-5-phosphate [Ignavibacteria bacterium]